MRSPRIELTLQLGAWETWVEAVADTGFEGGLIIPASLEADIYSQPIMRRVSLADGMVREAPHWDGSVSLGDHTFEAEIIGMGKQFLVGREVLDQPRICFDFGNRWVIRFRDGSEVDGEYSEPDE
jgi:hypothetical protein